MITNKEKILTCMRAYEESFAAEEGNGVTTQYLSDTLRLQRSNISAILNDLVKEEIVDKISGRPVHYRLKKQIGETEPCFSSLIGYNQSLRHAVQLAKAAVYYPNHSLHSLIVGPNGCGKASFAQTMYQFAITTKKLKEHAPYIRFDCRNYAGDKQNRDYEILFKDRENSMLAQAQNGILFLHHIEYLSLKAREQIFHLLENGVQMQGKGYKVLFICTLDSDTEGILKNSFISRFSILIHLSSLAEKEWKERFAFVQYFLRKEAVQTNLTIQADAQVMRSLLLYDCQENIKQLQKDIQIGCANAYAREFSQDKMELNLRISDFPFYVRKGFLNYKQNRCEVDALIDQAYTYRFSKEEAKKEVIVQASPERTIYDIIDQKSDERI